MLNYEQFNKKSASVVANVGVTERVNEGLAPSKHTMEMYQNVCNNILDAFENTRLEWKPEAQCFEAPLNSQGIIDNIDLSSYHYELDSMFGSLLDEGRYSWKNGIYTYKVHRVKDTVGIIKEGDCSVMMFITMKGKKYVMRKFNISAPSYIMFNPNMV